MAIIQQLAQALAAIPPELATVILATLPIGELRGALPVALTVYKLSIIEAITWSVIGNLLPVYFLLIFFERGSSWLAAHSELAAKILDKLYERTRRKLEHSVERYGYWALALFVAIPLPVTGAWTGSLAAHVFGISKKKAFWAIFVGLIVASIIVTLVTTGAIVSVNHLSS